MRAKIVAGNWKMNLLSEEANSLFDKISNSISNDLKATVMVFPSTIFIRDLVQKENNSIKIGIQNFYPKDKGAFTGEISISQVKDSGVTHVLIGHSERRAYFNETSQFLKEKVDSAIEYGLTIVFCCGEPLDVRENDQELIYVKSQLEESLFHLDASIIKNIVIAYEPVWAIGTGKTASIAQAESMHAEIRTWLSEKYNQEIANSISILYGGSCNASNAKELFACPNVDGGLIGGAALDADMFLKIANSF